VKKKNPPMKRDTPEQMFPSEYQMAISGASRKWQPSKDFPTFEDQIAFVLRCLREQPDRKP
jgi:hypothetical protein